MPAIPIEFAFTDGSQLYSMDVHSLIQTPVWEENRHLDEQHVTTLETTANPRTLQGPYSIITYHPEVGKEVNLLIDGQHRQAVLRNYFVTNPTAPSFQVLCRRYFPADHDGAVSIFKALNTAKPMVYAGSSTERLHEIQHALHRAFIAERGGKSKPIFLIRENCNRPCLNTAHLAKALKAHRLHERTDISIGTIVSHAEQMNAWYAEDTDRIPGTASQPILDKAKALSFYLGIDPSCAWLAGLLK